MARMPQKKQTAIRLSPEQRRTLDRLAKKLGVNRSNVIRIAINRLAEQEKLG